MTFNINELNDRFNRRAKEAEEANAKPTIAKIEELFGDRFIRDNAFTFHNQGPDGISIEAVKANTSI